MCKCPRDERCTKVKGHIGWCRTKQVAEDKNPFASRDAKKTRGGAARSKLEAMAALGARREARQRGVKTDSTRDDEDDEDNEDEEDDEGEDEDDEDNEDEQEARDDEDVRYSDFGLTRGERRAARERGFRGETEPEAEAEAEAGDDEWVAGGGPAALSELEGIRLKRQTLEKWLIEPFFPTTVRGCLVRIGISAARDGGQDNMLYRVAEVLAVQVGDVS